MHYFIDGYNLLFRIGDKAGDLQVQRERLIQQLGDWIDLLQLHASLVFDSAYQSGESSRSHRGFMEIIFTAEGETADDYILEVLKHRVGDPETVVTSDKGLAWRARRQEAITQDIDGFIQWLTKRVRNKLKPKSTKQTRKPQPGTFLPSPDTKAEQCNDFYQTLFVERFHALVVEEEASLEKKRDQRKTAPRKKQPKPKTEPLPALSDNDRWQSLFDRPIDPSEM